MLCIENFSLVLKGSDNRSLPVLEDISLMVRPGECLGIAGESGSGKSVLAMSIPGLIPRKSIQSREGRIIFADSDLLTMTENELQKVRGRKIGFVFQEPMTAMNPLMTLYEQVAEGIRFHFQGLTESDVRQKVSKALKSAGFSEPEKFYDSYPHQLSGGMRQRAMIGIGLALDPDIVIADEPTTAIDAGIQVQLLKELRASLVNEKTALVFISHDLGVLRVISDKLAVLYAGNLVEYGDTKEVLSHPYHPYSGDLMAALPRLVKERVLPKPIPGSLPRPDQKPSGCVYADRCSLVKDACHSARPPMKEIVAGRFARCLFPLKSGDAQ
ncbi:MAG: ABC transporter ATP-binding protein [Candidatus Rifleibacteriota bacterium]